MKLKTLEISGFKSFADKTIIDFMPGMTGIVGPNGSGKSNIIEAIRWVMGEQSAKDLRGSKMSDVIFGGTKNRKALNRAEVSITFDNSDHYVKSDFSEIRITRRLYRSGESLYQINGADCRLRDIHELFMDTGLGREGFSIISQGQVESIFSSKPEERRGIIEEVAGVYKYKQNKDKAEKELLQTSDNLSRVSDILHEVTNRLEPLSEQAKQAKLYLGKRESFEKLDQERLTYMVADYRQKRRAGQATLQTKQADLQSAQNDLNQLQAELGQKRQEQVNLQKAREDLQAQILKNTQAKEALLGDQKLAQQESATLERDYDALKRADEQQKHDFKAKQAELQSLDQQIKAWQEEADSLTASIRQIEKEHGQSKLEALQRELDSGRDTYIETMQALATIHNKQTFQAKSKNQLSARKEHLQRQLDESQADEKKLQDKLAAYQEQHPTGPTVDSQKQVEKVHDLEKLLADKQAAYRAADDDWRQANHRLEQQKSQYEALSSLDDYAGFYQGVRNLMVPQVRQQFPGILGLVGQRLQVPAQYTKAIETALGGALQQVIVDSTQSAKQIVSYLTKNRRGRVTILPVHTIKGRFINHPEQLQNQPGLIGIAADLVKIPSQMTAIKQHLLGTTLVAENLDAATRISKKLGQRYRIVTLDGQLINAGGSITGGANQRQGSTLLSRKAEVQKLAEQIEAFEKEVQAIVEKRDQIQQAGRQIQSDLEAAQQAKRELEAASQQKDYELVRQQDELRQAQRLVKSVQVELADIVQQLDEIEREEQQNADQLAEAQAKQARQEAHTKSLQEDLAQIQTELAQFNEEKSGLQSNLVATQTRLEGARVQRNSLSEAVANLQRTLEANQAAFSDYQKRLEQLANPTLLGQQAQELSAALQSDQAQVEEMAAELAQLGGNLEDLEQKNQTQQSRLNEAMLALSRFEQEFKQLEERLTKFESELLAKYGQELAEDQVIDESLDLAQLKQELDQLKSAMNQLGPVNLGAIEEYGELQKRYDFLSSQRADLEAAQQTLEETIADMDQEVQTRFKQTFDQVAGHFEKTFTKMFGGGQARLTLTDPEHLLTTGIDITAQPPGKKFQQMSLLSGGEKALTAISLLFAILQVRPVPFAVLDEAEAALDEANVDRFAHYLKNFEGQTQFITITHRKGTMTQANILYGVTMQEAGVSKMVAVNLDQASKSLEK